MRKFSRVVLLMLAVAKTAAAESKVLDVRGAEVLEKGKWSVEVSLDNSDFLAAPAPELRPPSRRSYRDMDVDDTRASVEVAAGLTQRLELEARISYRKIYSNAGDLAGFIEGAPYVGQFSDRGFENPRLVGRFAVSDRFSLSAGAEIGLGEGEAGIRSGETRWIAGAHGDLGRYVSASVEYVSSAEREDDVVTAFDLPAEIHAGIGVALPIGARTEWLNEISGVVYSGGTRDPDEPLVVSTGLGYQLGSGTSIVAGVRYNLTMATSENGSHPIGGVLAVRYRR